MMDTHDDRVGISQIVPAGVLAGIDGLYTPILHLSRHGPSTHLKPIISSQPGCNLPMPAFRMLSMGNQSADSSACPSQMRSG